MWPPLRTLPSSPWRKQLHGSTSPETADDTPRKRRRRSHIHCGCTVLRSWAGSSGLGRRHNPPRSPQPERKMRRGEEGGKIFPPATHVYCTSPENPRTKSQTKDAAHKESYQRSVRNLLHWATRAGDQAAATLCEITQASRRRHGYRHRACRKFARLLLTIAPRKCRALRSTQTHACLPTVFLDALRTARCGQLPADVPTPPRESKNTRQGHTDRFSNLQRKRWTTKRQDVARGSCLLRTVSGQQTGITCPINWKCEHRQLEMGQTSTSLLERFMD